MPGPGKPFQKGQHVPGRGRKKQTIAGKAFAQILKEAGPETARLIAEVAADRKHKDWFNAAKLVASYHPPQTEEGPDPLPDGQDPTEPITVVRKTKEKPNADG